MTISRVLVGLAISATMCSSAVAQVNTGASRLGASDAARRAEQVPAGQATSELSMIQALSSRLAAAEDRIGALQKQVTNLQASNAAVQQQVTLEKSDIAKAAQSAFDAKLTAGVANVWINANGPTILGVVQDYPNHKHSYQQTFVTWHNLRCKDGNAGPLSKDSVECSDVVGASGSPTNTSPPSK